MQTFTEFVDWTRNRLTSWGQALRSALSEPAPLETDAFAGCDDGSVFQPLAARARAQREGAAVGPTTRS